MNPYAQGPWRYFGVNKTEVMPKIMCTFPWGGNFAVDSLTTIIKSYLNAKNV